MDSREPPAAGTAGNQLPSKRDDNKLPRIRGKARHILTIFATGKSLNTFEAQNLGDTCLNSTVSELARRYRLEFTKAPESVRNRFGTVTRVTRYTLAPASRGAARALLLGIEQARGDAA